MFISYRNTPTHTRVSIILSSTRFIEVLITYQVISRLSCLLFSMTWKWQLTWSFQRRNVRSFRPYEQRIVHNLNQQLLSNYLHIFHRNYSLSSRQHQHLLAMQWLFWLFWWLLEIFQGTFNRFQLPLLYVSMFQRPF